MKVTGTVEETTEHNSVRSVPEMRGEFIFSTDTLMLGAKGWKDDIIMSTLINPNTLTIEQSPKAHGGCGSVPYTVTSSHSVVVCGILLQITQCDRVGGVSIYNVCCTIDSVTLCKVCVSLLTTVEYVVGLSSVCYTEDSDPDSGIGGVDIVDSSSGNIGD